MLAKSNFLGEQSNVAVLTFSYVPSDVIQALNENETGDKGNEWSSAYLDCVGVVEHLVGG